MNESFDKDFSNHTPMMQQYLSTLINILKNKILIKKYSINIHIVYII